MRPASSARTISATATSILPTNARLRRVLRQSLPSQCRGGAGAAVPIRAIPAFRKSSSAARRASQCLAPTARSRTPGRSPRSAWRRSTTRRRPPPWISWSGRCKANKPFFCWFNYDAHALPSRMYGGPRAGRPACTALTEYADGMIEHDGHVGQILKKRRRSRHRQRHDRDLHDRQRSACQFLAGCRHDAVPQREEHQLGRRLPRALR